MNNLSTAEDRYFELIQFLSQSYSRRNKIFHLLQFLNSLIDKPSILSVYSLELIPRFCEEILDYHFKYTPLAFVYSIKKLLVLLQSFNLQEELKDNLEKTIEHVQNEIDAIELLINKKNNVVSYGEKPIKLHTQLFSLNNSISTKVFIPLVETEPLFQNDTARFGIISEICLEAAFLPSEANEDEIDFPHILDQENKATEHWLELVQTAKNLFFKLTSIAIKKNLFVRCRITESQLITGDSLDAGFVTALMTNFFHLYELRFFLSPRIDTAFTGQLHDDDKLFPVDEEGLKVKIESCLFSEINYLVVPKEQESFCKNYIDLLQNKNEFKPKLEIIGLGKISESFYDRRILEQQTISFITQAIRRSWKKRRSIAAFAFLLLLILLGKMMYGPLDTHPDWIDFAGNRLLIKNKENDILKGIEIGSGYVKAAADANEHQEKTCDLIDIDGDGYKDVIYIKRFSISEKYDYLVCESVYKNLILWKFQIKKEINIPNNPSPEDRFWGLRLLVGDYDKDGKIELYLLTANGFSPGVIFKIDALTGKEIGYYTHCGNLNAMKVVDLDEDGNEDILCGGTNQAFGTACIIVLDPRKFGGYGPTDKRNHFSGLNEATEKYYLQIPMTMIGKAYGDTVSYSMVSRIAVDFETKQIKADIRDADLEEREEVERPPNYVVYFDFKLNPVFFDRSTQYSMRANGLLKQKRIKTFPDVAYFQNFFKEFIYLKKPQAQ